MCGIAGIFATKASAPVDISAKIGRMVQTIEHRGPDDQGVWIGSGIALGHARLSIIDLTAAGHQPMPNKEGSGGLAEGCVYARSLGFEEIMLDIAQHTALIRRLVLRAHAASTSHIHFSSEAVPTV